MAILEGTASNKVEKLTGSIASKGGLGGSLSIGEFGGGASKEQVEQIEKNRKAIEKLSRVEIDDEHIEVLKIFNTEKEDFNEENCEDNALYLLPQEDYASKEHMHNDYALKEHSHNNYAEKNQLPTKTSQLQNDSGFVTDKQLSGYSKTDHKHSEYATTQQFSKLAEQKADKEVVENLPNNATMIRNVANVVKTEVPLVKTPEQPNFANTVHEMTDTSKVYVMPDMSMWAYMSGAFRVLTADDFIVAGVNTDGSYYVGANCPYSRICNVDLLPLTDGNVVSISCPTPYQYIVYYYTSDSDSDYIGKTSFKSGVIADVTQDTVTSGTKSGATHCRISLRDVTDTNANLSDRVNEFISNVSVVKKNATGKEWCNTGFTYNQPSDVEDRVVALEKALEDIAYGEY